MDSSHVAIAASGLLSGLWFQEPDHSVAASERGHSEGLWFRLAGIGVLVLLAKNLALAFRVSFRRDEAGLQGIHFVGER